MNYKNYRRKYMALTAALLLLAALPLIHIRAEAEDSGVYETSDAGIAAYEIAEDPGISEDMADSQNSAEGDGPVQDQESEMQEALEDISGLFSETGEDQVQRDGETLEDARRELYGIADGGSTVNIGHLYEINGVLVRNSDFPSEHYECWTYANNIYAKIWGHNFLNLFNDSENMLRELADEDLTLTPEHLKAYVSAAPAGAVLRVCDEQYLHADDGWGHSQIIISHDENGFTVFEGGLAAWPHRREAYYTWNGYCYSNWPGKYHYIKYIKWPGAGAYMAGTAGENAKDLGQSEAEQLQPAVEETFRDLVEIIGGMIRGDAEQKDVNKLMQAVESLSTGTPGNDHGGS